VQKFEEICIVMFGDVAQSINNRDIAFINLTVFRF